MSSSPPSHPPSSSSSKAQLSGFEEQWSQLNKLLPLSPDDNQIVSTSSPLVLEVSAILHDRLSHFERTKWPLDRIYEFLDSFFKSHPYVHHRSLQSKQVADPTTPVKPTSALPQQALENTPRTAKATSLLAQLRGIEDWGFLIGFHKMACDMYSKDKSWDDDQLRWMAKRLIKNESEFCAVIPELNNVFSDDTPVVGRLATVYNNLASRFPTFNSPDQALAVVIVHLAQSHVKRPRDPEVIGTNIHLENGFYRPYCGDAPNRFLTFVSHLNAVYNKLGLNEPKPYFRGTPIVQSSGTGKTRMVYECQQRTPLLYVCFRKSSADSNAKAGYPLPDQGIRTYFANAQRDYPNSCDLQVACFLSAWFTTLAQALRPWQTDAEKYQHLCDLNRFEPVARDDDLPEPLDRYPRNNRFEPVSRDDDLPEPLDRYPRNNHFKVISELAASNLPTVFKLVEGKASKSFRTPSYEKIFDVALRQPLLDLNEQLTAVSRHLHSGQAGVPVPPVLVAFDECIEMIVTTPYTANNQLNSLRRAWNYVGTLQAKYETLSFWLVLMSTSSSAAYLVEHVDAQSSLRRRNSAPLHTFVGVGVDVLAEEQRALSCASQASSHDHLIRYGRPLWPALECSNFWDNVLFKLQGKEDFSADNTAQCFSVMASRLALGLVPVHEGGGALFGEQKLFMDKTVDRHMRMVSRISNDATMYVNSPSEPVLAIAASLIMLCTATKKLEPKPVDMYGSIMGNFQGRCLVDSAIAGFKGMHGELASRMALIVAWDAAKRKELDALKQQTTLNHVKVLTRAVPLETILSELADLDEANADQLRQRVERVQQDGSSTRPALQPPRTGTSAASSTMAWTNFTHFDALPEHITEISPEYLWYCWKRGVGLQMAHSQHGIDGILPVFMGNLDRPFVTPTGTQDDAATSIEMHAARYMTYVAWEAKNRDEPQPGAGSGKPDVMLKLAGPSIMRASHAPLGERPLTERALLCVLLDMGTSTPFASKPQGFRPRVQTINGTECPRLCIRGVTNEHAYPCLDVLKIRAIFEQILTALAEIPTFEQFNVVSNPIWNDRVQPALPSISATGVSNPPAAAAAAAATDDDNGAPQRKRQRMDLD
ncbi:related to conserved hypothetical Ustilaginaceae-specific protein [Ustilago sp. UG-2017b]|nr:related to conserved hypothetical Ustilaginaceae-specific protein [Ustilago sp. UG-2017b]